LGGEYDVVVVGGGPGGYPGAVVAAKSGLRVALVEEARVGGECASFGCVPSKALVKAYSALGLVRRVWGSGGGGFGGALAFARGVAGEVVSGLESLLERVGVEVVRGRGVVLSGRRVRVGGSTLEARLGVLCACGSEPWAPRGFRVDNVRVLDNRGFFSRGLPEGTESVLVVGGGFVGVELSLVLARAGFRVTLVEALGRLLPGMDRDFSLLARRLLAREGVSVRLSTRVDLVESRGERVYAVVGGSGEYYDVALVAVGRKPRVPAVDGLEVEGGFVRVDSCGRTSVAGLYAAGDVAGPPMLAHKAMHESVRAVECMMGREPGPRGPVPVVVYGPIDMVSVGYTLEEAARVYGAAEEVRVPTGGLAAQRAHGVVDGFAKLVVARGRVVGVHAAFPGASEASGEASLLASLGVPVEELAGVVHAHPTVSEALWEAAMEYLGGGVHVVRGRRQRRGSSTTTS